MRHLYIIFLLVGCWVNAQNAFIEKFQHNFEHKSPVDNIYIQTDKEVYKTSEIIWFKAYVLNSKTLEKSLDNKILFVVLKEKNSQKTVLEKKFEITDGLSNGNLFLEADLQPGDYQLFCFTASSIVNNNLPLQSFKSIRIKGDTKNILMETTFDQSDYDDHAPVHCKIGFYHSDGSPLNTNKVKVIYKEDTKILDRETLDLSDDGDLDFSLNPKYSHPDIKVYFSVKTDIEATLELDIPYRFNESTLLYLFPEGGKIVSGLPNKIAFKATKRNGKPIAIKAELIENETSILSFKSFHDGMGFFNLTPKPNSIYKIKIKEPYVSFVDLPKIETVGYTMNLISHVADDLKILISKSERIIANSVNLVIQSKGEIHFMAKINLKDNKQHVRIPKRDLPKGVLELLLYDLDFKPIAERLVLAKPYDNLKLTNLKDLEPTYSNKEKITFKFKLTSKDNAPVLAHLNLRVFDKALFAPQEETNIVYHYTLFSDLRGQVHNPMYYFDSKNKRRYEHFDLLLLTHGWRHYKYSERYFKTISANHKSAINDDYFAKVLRINKNNQLINIEEPIFMDIYYPSGSYAIYTNKSGLFNIPLKENEIALVKPKTDGDYYIKSMDAFPELIKLMRSKSLKVSPFLNQETPPTKNELLRYYSTKYMLNEVVVNGSKDRNPFWDSDPFKKRVASPVGDYVCYQFNILNCVNHTTDGYLPVKGHTYSLNGGGRILYNKDKIEPYLKTEKRKDYLYVTGYDVKKEFFSPNYTTASKQNIDNRTTLAWLPDLKTNKDGIVEASFYTSDISSAFNVHVEGLDDKGNLFSEYYNFRVTPNYFED